MLVNIVCHPGHEPALKFLFVREVLLPDSFLAQRAFLPMCLPCLVTAQMYDSGREQFHDLVQNPFNEGEDFIIACTENDVGVITAQPRKYSDELVHHWAGQQRIGCKGCIAVSRHLDFGDDLNLPFSGVGYNLPDIILCIISARDRRLPLSGIEPFGEIFSRPFNPA